MSILRQQDLDLDLDLDLGDSASPLDLAHIQPWGNAAAQDQLLTPGQDADPSATELLSDPDVFGPVEVVADRQETARDVALGEVARGSRERGGEGPGPDVEGYLASTGGDPGDQWCGAFVSWCMQRAGLDPALGPHLASDTKALNLFLYQDYSEHDAEQGRNPELRALRQEHEEQGSTRQLFLVRRPDGTLTPGADYVQDRLGRFDAGVALDLVQNTFTPDQLPLQAGDVVVFHAHDEGGHVALVDSYDPETGALTIIEGNNGPRVRTRTIQMEDWMDTVTGFGRFSAEDFDPEASAEGVAPPGEAIDEGVPEVQPEASEAREEERRDPVVAAEQDQDAGQDVGQSPEEDPESAEIPLEDGPHRVADLEPGSPAWQTRYDLVERFLDIGYEQGGQSPYYNREMVPADLIESCVRSGNWDLVILFVGIGEWGVEGTPEDLADPYLDHGASIGWDHTRGTGKSITDYDPWGAQGGYRQSHGGLGIVHLDSGGLRDLYRLTRGERIQHGGHDKFTHQELLNRDGEVIPWPEDLVAPDLTQELIADEVNFDGIRARWPDAASAEADAWQEWARAFTRDRDAQHLYIDMVAETFVEEGLFIAPGDAGYQDAMEDPYLRAMYGAVRSSTVRGGFEAAVRDYDPEHDEGSVFDVAARGANDHNPRHHRTRGYTAERAAALIRYYSEQSR